MMVPISDCLYSQALDCMKAPWIPLIIIGGQWPALLILIIGMERFLAVFKPIYYRATVNNKHRIYAIIASVAIFLIYMSCAYGQRIIFGGEDTPVINTCLVTPTFLSRFDDIHRGIVVFGKLFSHCLKSAKKKGIVNTILYDWSEFVKHVILR
jgi:hypothetical protein